MCQPSLNFYKFSVLVERSCLHLFERDADFVVKLDGVVKVVETVFVMAANISQTKEAQGPESGEHTACAKCQEILDWMIQRWFRGFADTLKNALCSKATGSTPPAGR
eukprot:s2204_g3.t1